MRVSIFGLGYVGTVSAACLAQHGHHVIGVDISSIKVKIINDGRSPVIEQGVDELIAQGVADGHLRATTDAAEGILNSDLSMICVGTPSSDNGSLNLTFVERVCQQIGQALTQKSDFHTVVLRSTVLPGTTEGSVIPALEKASGRVVGQNLGVCFNPEFLREGTSLHDFYHTPFTVIGQCDSRAPQVVSSLYQFLTAPLLIVPLRVAEMVKYANNAFHALKVTFTNEIGNICKLQGIDSHRVMEIFCMDDKLNLSPYYLKPGFAFGGSCLPKDLRALLYHGHRLDLTLPVLESILPSNELQVRRSLEMIRQTGSKKVGVLGLSFKVGTDDMRESPVVQLVEMLIGKGYQVKIYDRNVSLARLHGANRAYIERQIPHIVTLMCHSIDEVLSNCEVIVIGNKASEFQEAIRTARSGQTIVDLVRISDDVEEIMANYQGICW